MRTQAEREYDLLIQALAEMPPPPCGVGRRSRCSEWAVCSGQKKACARYKHWVDFGLSDENYAKIPSTGIFDKVFSKLEDGQVELALTGATK